VLRLLRGALTQTGRLVGTALAVALAVTLVSGTFVLTDTIDAAFHTAATPSADGGADLVIRSTALFSATGNSLPEREPLPDSLVAKVAAVPGVKAAWAAIRGYAELIDTGGKAIAPKGLPTVGSGWAPDDALVSGRPPQGPGEVAIDAATAAQGGRRGGRHQGHLRPQDGPAGAGPGRQGRRHPGDGRARRQHRRPAVPDQLRATGPLRGGDVSASGP